MFSPLSSFQSYEQATPFFIGHSTDLFPDKDSISSQLQDSITLSNSTKSFDTSTATLSLVDQSAHDTGELPDYSPAIQTKDTSSELHLRRSDRV